MNDAEIAAYFVERLSKSDNADDLIMEICEKTGRKWDEVEALLARVRVEQEHEIVRRRSPLLVTMALVTYLAGVGIAIYSTYFLIVMLEEYFANPVHPLGVTGALQAVAAVGYTAVGGLAAGLAMMLGSLLGMKKIWMHLLK